MTANNVQRPSKQSSPERRIKRCRQFQTNTDLLRPRPLHRGTLHEVAQRRYVSQVSKTRLDLLPICCWFGIIGRQTESNQTHKNTNTHAGVWGRMVCRPIARFYFLFSDMATSACFMNLMTKGTPTASRPRWCSLCRRSCCRRPSSQKFCSVLADLASRLCSSRISLCTHSSSLAHAHATCNKNNQDASRATGIIGEGSKKYQHKHTYIPANTISSVWCETK